MTQSNLVTPKIIVGLGNPEEKYYKTRHNIGFEAVDTLAKTWQLSWQENRRFQGMSAEGSVPHGPKIILLKPLTYMNLSGQSVRAVVDWYKFDTDSVLVIYDDMDLPLGKIRLRLSGSAGGHNGMKSIITHLGTQNFARLRLGIGKSQDKTRTLSHVLGRFSEKEMEINTRMLQLVVEVVTRSFQDGLAKTMSLYNNHIPIES